MCQNILIMASVKQLKKNIHHVLGDIIEECYFWELANSDTDTKKSQAIIDEAAEIFDDLLDRINIKNIESKKQHFKTINNELETKAKMLLDKVNKL